ncbi:hypothetical protein ACFUTX_02475 [Microbacterium sp. NPDC057407]|uniref:hypothetical protein n=1 Tax=Microbacterium sp. NPDC057407 TaxID=3346120 RepID=UPI00367129B2
MPSHSRKNRAVRPAPETIAEWSTSEREHARPPTHIAAPEVPDGDLAIELTRPRDLVSVLTVWHGVEATPADDSGPASLIAGAEATLTLHLPFQHAQEHAWSEGGGSRPNPSDPSTSVPAGTSSTSSQFRRGPVNFRAARASRLVFDVPEGTRVDVDSASILRLIPTLPLRVHELAKPGRAPDAFPEFPVRPTHPKPGWWRLSEDLIVRVRESQVTVQLVTPTQRRRYPLAEGVDAQRAQAKEILDSIVASAGSIRLDYGRGLDPDILPDAIKPDRGDAKPRPARRGEYGSPPTPDQTAIEAPFRLVISPDSGGRWTHAAEPVPAPADARHVELWHTRLGRATEPEEGEDAPGVSEEPSRERIIRAVWTRDRDHLTPAEWRSPDSDVGDEPPQSSAYAGPLAPPAPPSSDRHPFPSSLNRSDRHRIVRQSAETWTTDGGTPIPPVPVGADKLWLSAFGATLDLHGHWDTLPYSGSGIPSILAWDHVATFGRDQFVRVVYPGYLFPLGHKAVLVKITERKIRVETSDAYSPKRPIAGLWQRHFIAVIQRDRTYKQVDLPFIDAHLGPAVTPTLDEPTSTNTYFWPTIDGKAYRFRVDANDRAGRPLPFTAPLLWVAEHVTTFDDVRDFYLGFPGGADERTRRVIDLGGRTVALYRDEAADLTASHEVQRMRLTGVARLGTSEPHLSTADIVVEAARRLADTPATTIAYHGDVVEGQPLRAGAVWAAVATTGALADPATATHIAPTDPKLPAPPGIRFGEPLGPAGPGKTSETGGGFVAPSQAIAGLSLLTGTVADLTQSVEGTFDPGTALGSADALAALGTALPKLFGLVPLIELLDAVGIDAPEILASVTEPLTQIIQTVQNAKALAERAKEEAEATAQRVVGEAQQKVADAVAGAEASAQAFLAAQQAKVDALTTEAQGLATEAAGVVDDVVALFQGIADLDLDAAKASFDALRARLAALAARMRAIGAGLLPPLVRTKLADAAALLDGLSSSASIVEEVYQAAKLVAGLASGAKQIELRFDWAPPLKDWPNSTAPILAFLPRDGTPKKPLTISVTGTAGVDAKPSLKILAELREFRLDLLPIEPLLQIEFEHLSFRSGTSGKTEVDVVLRTVRFVGILSFVETIKELIPFDGFSDPPDIAVDASGLTAGYTLALPNVAIGVFALSNMSLSADLRVPFLGDGLSVGFGFCSRERPFTLAVVFLGGGGWFAMRLSPKRLELLEIGLEAGAYLSVDFGVASGSISAAIGIYLRMESDKGSLTGYFRLRGEVDVLGLISASIELAMSLTYDFAENKVIGRASITVEVEVLFFSASVTIEAERKFAGSNGDPSVREIITAAGGDTSAWTDYLDAFATEEP